MIPVYLLSSACFAALANFFFRRNLEKGGTSSAFLSLYFFASLLVCFLFNPTTLHSPFSPVMAMLGACAGCLNFMMLTLTAKSFELGPPGLTLTFQNASCIFPGLLLCLVFGPSFGFFLTPWLITGFVFIILGLYLSSRTYGKLSSERVSIPSQTMPITAQESIAKPHESSRDLSIAKGDTIASLDTASLDDRSNPGALMQSHDRDRFGKWLLCVIPVMVLQGLILTLFQWRVLLFKCHENTHWLIPWTCQKEEDVWFIPAFFLVPTLSQLFLFWKKEGRKFSSSEVTHGLTSGGLNCACTALLLLATKTEGVLKKEMLFPLFTISVILLCNIWSTKIYKERVNWIGIILCVAGVLIGLIQ